MKRCLTLALATAALLATAVPGFAATHKTPPWGNGPFKVLLEVNQNNPGEWKTTINNLRTMEKVVGMSTAHAEVIAWGPGLKMLMKNSPYAKDIQSLSVYGIEFAACHQSMKAMHVSKADLAQGVTVVPGAIAEMVKRHNTGWTEIKE
jgi:intracellular sulfur oxidation DsrE/DsrF family protein